MSGWPLDEQRDDPPGRDRVLAAAGGAQPAGRDELAQVVVELAAGAEPVAGTKVGGGTDAVQYLAQ
jgi:hypothetical protein